MATRSRAIASLAYPWRTQLNLDPLWATRRHVDNVQIAALFNEGRVLLNSEFVARAGKAGFCDQMIAHIAIDFLSELLWRPDVWISAGVEKIGTASYTIELVLQADDIIFARCLTTNVWVTEASASPISTGARSMLGDFLLISPP